MQSEDQNTLSDQELARQAQGGSLSSFEELVYRYEKRVYRFLLRCCRNETSAQDLTQLSFVAAWRGIDQYDPNCSFPSWLFTIARRKFIDHYRRVRPETDVIPENPDVNDPFVLLDQEEQQRRVWDWARGLLSAEQFQALWFFYQEQMKIKEIAQAMSRTQISVRILLFRAKKRLARAHSRIREDAVPALALVKENWRVR